MIGKVVVGPNDSWKVPDCGASLGARFSPGRDGWQKSASPKNQVLYEDSSGNGINQDATDTGGFYSRISLSLSIAWLRRPTAGSYGLRPGNTQNQKLHFLTASWVGNANVHPGHGCPLVVGTAPQPHFQTCPLRPRRYGGPRVLTLPVLGKIMQAEIFSGARESVEKAAVCLRKRRRRLRTSSRHFTLRGRINRVSSTGGGARS